MIIAVSRTAIQSSLTTLRPQLNMPSTSHDLNIPLTILFGTLTTILAFANVLIAYIQYRIFARQALQSFHPPTPARVEAGIAMQGLPPTSDYGHHLVAAMRPLLDELLANWQ